MFVVLKPSHDVWQRIWKSNTQSFNLSPAYRRRSLNVICFFLVALGGKWVVVLAGYGWARAPLLPSGKVVAEFGRRCPAGTSWRRQGLAFASDVLSRKHPAETAACFWFSQNLQKVESACSASVTFSWNWSMAPKATWADKSRLWHPFSSGVQAKLQTAGRLSMQICPSVLHYLHESVALDPALMGPRGEAATIQTV